MGSELRPPHHAQQRETAMTPLQSSRENVSPLLRVTKQEDLPNYQTTVLFQHGEKAQEVTVDSDVANLVVLLGQGIDRTRHEIAEELETTPDHVRQMEASAKVALADSIVRPTVFSPEDRHDAFLRLEINAPEETTESSLPTAEVTPITELASRSTHARPEIVKKERSAELTQIVGEFSPFINFPDNVIDVIEEKTKGIAAIPDDEQLLSAQDAINVFRIGARSETIETLTPQEYFNERIAVHTALNPNSDPRAQAFTDLRGKLAAKQTERALYDLRRNGTNVSKEQIAYAQEVAERLAKTPPATPITESA